MGRIVSFDLDEALLKAKLLSEELPGLVSTLEAAGFGWASKVTQFGPLLGPCSTIASKLLGNSKKDGGLSGPDMPDTGPLGRGRLSYMRRYAQFNDDQVCSAYDTVAGINFPNWPQIQNTIGFTLSCMFGGEIWESSNNQNRRRAIDQVLNNDGLSEGTCDKLGDWLWFALNNPATKK